MAETRVLESSLQFFIIFVQVIPNANGLTILSKKNNRQVILQTSDRQEVNCSVRIEGQNEEADPY